jgi:septum formation inhibitor-activating ATPase MinD
MIVLSRADRHAEIGVEDLQGAVGAPVKHVFPSDYRLAVGALNRGEPLVTENKSALASAFKNFARDLAGAGASTEIIEKPPVEKGGGLFGRLTGRR